MRTREEFDRRLSLLKILAISVGLGILGLSYKVFEPLFAGTTAQTSAKKVEVPAYDYQAWYAWPVQEGGRVKPFQTACIETMRSITGLSDYVVQSANERAQPQKKHIDAVAVVLQWMLLQGASDNPQFIDWEHQAFILCEQYDLRKKIYEHLPNEEGLTEQRVHGKYISPADLRESPGFKQLIDEARMIEMKDRVELARQVGPKIVTNTLGLGAVDHADGAFEAGPAE